MPVQAPWPDHDGAFWVRLAFMEGISIWHEVPLVVGTITHGRITDVQVLAPVFDVPFLRPHDSSEATVNPSWRVVRGSGTRVYLVETGALRWVPDLEVFTRHGLKWEDVVTIPDEDLQSIPLGLPLD